MPLLLTGNRRQEDIEYYTPVIYDALDYVHEHSTEQMKEYISRGEFIIGMNQHEVMASLYKTGFMHGVPVSTNKYTSVYGKLETWEIGGRTGSIYSSYSPPKYILTFTDYILTGIYEP